MPELVVTTRDGREHIVAGDDGLSVMEVIRENGFDELIAMCGGNCSCATCHVFVAPEDWGRLPAMGVDEDELLDTSEFRTEYSRLSCQLALGEALAGLRVMIAPED